MTTMVERVARAIAASIGGEITEPSRSRALDEFGWSPDQGHIGKFVEAYWKKYVNAAQFAIEAMKEPTPAMTNCNEDVASAWGYSCHVCGGPKKTWDDMIKAALEEM